MVATQCPRQIDGGTDTLEAGSALALHLRVKEVAGQAVLAGSTDDDIGTTLRRAFAAGDDVSIRLATAAGVELFIAVDAITVGNPFYAAANGKVSASGTLKRGIARSTTTADGDILAGQRTGDTSVASSLGGTTAAAFEVDSDSATPKIASAAQTGGTGDFTTTLKPETTLSADNAIIVPEADGDTLVAAALAQTLTNKTLTAPVITTPSITRLTEKHTAGDTLTAAESGSRHSNKGASGTITLILPAAVAGLEFDFNVNAAQQLRLDPNGSETIALPSTGVQGGAGKYLVADAVGENVKVYCETTGEWEIASYAGTWTAEP